MARRLQRVGAMVCAFVLLAFVALIEPADAATLNGIRIDSAAGQSAHVTLAFTNGVPNYKVFGNNSSDVTLVLQSSTRGVNAPAQVVGQIPLRSIEVEPLGDSLNVTFHESGPSMITVTPGPGQTLLVLLVTTSVVPTLSPFGAVAPTPAPTPVPQNLITEVVRLKYADVSEVVGLLVPGQSIASNDNFTPQEQSFGGTGGTTGGVPGANQFNTPIGGGGGLAQPNAFGGGFGGANNALGQQINENIGVDRRLNAIILTGTPDQVARFKAKISLIDIALPSVEFETQIVELDDTAARDIGIDPAGAGGGQLASASYTIKSLATGQGTIGLQAAVYGEIQKGLGRSIARPRITALDGTPAQIITGTQIPIINTVTLSGVSGTTSQVQYINVGVSLQILPRINDDGFVTSHIFSQVSSVTSQVVSNGSTNPELSQREASTEATVKDGDSFVIGGLLQQSDLYNFAKTPGLGDIPIIGGLFHVHHDSVQNTNLYIIVTPHIIHNGDNPPAPKPLPPQMTPPPNPVSK